MPEKIIVNDFSRTWIENGILYGQFSPNVIIDLEIAKITIEARLNICEGKDYLFLCDMSHVKSVTKEAREYLSTDVGIKGITAGALIIDSTVSRVIGNFFLSINKPKVPAKLFTNKEDAIRWLQQFQ